MRSISLYVRWTINLAHTTMTYSLVYRIRMIIILIHIYIFLMLFQAKLASQSALHFWNPLNSWGVCGTGCQTDAQVSNPSHQQSLPSQETIYSWVLRSNDSKNVLLKDLSFKAGVRTHTLKNRPPGFEFNEPDRLAATRLVRNYFRWNDFSQDAYYCYHLYNKQAFG